RAELLENSLEINQYFKHLRPEVTTMINLTSIAKNIFPINSENIDIAALTTNNFTYLYDIAHTSE
ncbi:MAG: hypothetical protein QF704_06750, partial [Anaerolineales bacterium]|nr:hypothetical protein [Anaerolineales bacterium]